MAERFKALVSKANESKGSVGSNPTLSASFGRMVEWFMASALKADESKGSGGSNPSSSAISRKGCYIRNGIM